MPCQKSIPYGRACLWPGGKILGCSGKFRLKRFAAGYVSSDVEKNAVLRVLITEINGCGRHEHLWIRREAYAL